MGSLHNQLNGTTVKPEDKVNFNFDSRLNKIKIIFN